MELPYSDYHSSIIKCGVATTNHLQIPYDEYLVDVYNRDMLNEIVELIVDTVCSEQEMIRIGGDRKPKDVVKSQFLKLNSEHIRFVLKCLKENTSKVINIRQYLLTVLYNAPLTISNYYSALVQHDMYGDSEE